MYDALEEQRTKREEAERAQRVEAERKQRLETMLAQARGSTAAAAAEVCLR